MRTVSDKNILDEFCIKFCRVVEKYCKYVVCSGFVAISSGRTRATEDIDMIIERLDPGSFSHLHRDLVKEGFVCMQSDSAEEIFSYLKENDSVRYTFADKPLPEMEMKFAKDLLDRYQIQTRTKLPLTGLDIWFSNVNVNIAFKEELLKADKDIKDAEHLRKVYPELVDEKKIRHVKDMIKRFRL